MLCVGYGLTGRSAYVLSVCVRVPGRGMYEWLGALSDVCACVYVLSSMLISARAWKVLPPKSLPPKSRIGGVADTHTLDLPGAGAPKILSLARGDESSPKCSNSSMLSIYSSAVCAVYAVHAVCAGPPG